ncbi:hypothetical protein LOM8899_01088 [Flavimaricola marinus]|uniref:Transposase n=1 Tax=Flavimaricola marinus TaxID=1819565 RepID=A0A238LBF0_9RHOB|nr:hypothetical protein LOM8899_01088 [Flavimaricola marinus]
MSKREGIFKRIMAWLTAKYGQRKTLMIDATYLNAHRTATSMAARNGGYGRVIGRTKGGINTYLHAACER